MTNDGTMYINYPVSDVIGVAMASQALGLTHIEFIDRAVNDLIYETLSGEDEVL